MKYIIQILAFVMLVSVGSGTIHAKVGSESTVSPMKHWTITFNTSMDPSTIHNKSIYVKSASGEKLEQELFFTDNNKKVTIKAPSGGYEEGKEYTLYIAEDIKSNQGVPINERSDFSFKIHSKTELVKITSLDVEKEMVTLFNGGDNPVDLSDWSVLSVEGSQMYDFPDGFVLQPKKIVTITSGKDAKEEPPVYLKWTNANIWNNTNDSAKLLDDQNEIMSEYE